MLRFGLPKQSVLCAMPAGWQVWDSVEYTECQIQDFECHSLVPTQPLQSLEQGHDVFSAVLNNFWTSIEKNWWKGAGILNRETSREGWYYGRGDEARMTVLALL